MLSKEFQLKQQRRYQSMYNQISVEHDIPLDVAEALITHGAYVLATVLEAHDRKMPNKERVGVVSLVGTWGCLGKYFGWSEAKIEAIIAHAMDLIMPLLLEAERELARTYGKR